MEKYIIAYKNKNGNISIKYNGNKIDIFPQKDKRINMFNYYEIELNKKISLNDLKKMDIHKLEGKKIYIVPINIFKMKIINDKQNIKIKVINDKQNIKIKVINNVCNIELKNNKQKPNIYGNIIINNPNSITIDRNIFERKLNYNSSYNNTVSIYNDRNNNKIVIKSGNISQDIYIIKQLDNLDTKCNNIVPMRVYNKYIIMEYMDGDLQLFTKNKNKLDPQLIQVQFLNILLQIVNILICLKKINMCYLDLKIDNIFYKCIGKNNYIIMLGDLGGMQEFDKKQYINVAYKRYVNNYFINNFNINYIKNINETQMVWSFGILILQLLNNKVNNKYIFNLNNYYISKFNNKLYKIINYFPYKKIFVLYLKKYWDSSKNNIYFAEICTKIFILRNKQNINKDNITLTTSMFKNIYDDKYIKNLLINFHNMIYYYNKCDNIAYCISINKVINQFYSDTYKHNANILHKLGYNNIKKLYLAVTSSNKNITLEYIKNMIDNML